jgi:hypothetical protein
MYKYNLSIASCFRNELPFLEEWIKYHLLIGIQHFYLANNDIDKAPANHLLLPYIKKGIVTLLPECELVFGHWKSIPRLLKLAAGKTKWLAVIDIDEFIYPQKQDFDIYPIIKEFEKSEIAALGIGWCTYGSADQIFHQPLVTQSYLRRAYRNHPVNSTNKLIIRPEYVNECKGHSFLFRDGNVVNTLFNKIEINEECKYKTKEIIWNKLRLNHYPIKSLEDFFKKIERGYMGKFWTSNNNQFWSHYFAEFNRNEEKDTGMLFIKDQLFLAIC